MDLHSFPRVTGVVSLDDLMTIFARQTEKLAEVISSEIAAPEVDL